MVSIMRLTFLLGLMLGGVIAEGEPVIPPTAPMPVDNKAVTPLILPRNDPDPKMTYKPVVLDPEAPAPVKPLGWTPPPAPPVVLDMDKAVVPKVVKSDADLAQEEMEKRFISRPIVLDPNAPLPADAAVKLCPGCPADVEKDDNKNKVEAETTHDDVVSAISIDDTVQEDDLNADLTTRLNELMKKMNMSKVEKKNEQEVKNSASLDSLSKKLKEKAPLTQIEQNFVKQFQAQFELMDEKKKEIKTEEAKLANETLVLKKQAAKATVVEQNLVQKATKDQSARKEESKKLEKKIESIEAKKSALKQEQKKVEAAAAVAITSATTTLAASGEPAKAVPKEVKAVKADLKLAKAEIKLAEEKATVNELKDKVKDAKLQGNTSKVADLKAKLKDVKEEKRAAEKSEVVALKADLKALSKAVEANPTPANEKTLVDAVTQAIAKTAETVEKKVVKIDKVVEKAGKSVVSNTVRSKVDKKVEKILAKTETLADDKLTSIMAAAAVLPAKAAAKLTNAVQLVNKEVAKATKPKTKAGSFVEGDKAAAKTLKKLANAMPKLQKKMEKVVKVALAAPKAAPAMATAPKAAAKVPAVSAKKVADDIQVIKSSMQPATKKIPAIVPSPETDAEMAFAGAKINMYLQKAGRLVSGVTVPPTPTVDFSPKLRSALAKADEALAKLDALFYDGSKKLKAIALRRAKLGEQLTDLGAALPESDIGAVTATCCQPHPAPPALSDLPAFNPAPPVPDFTTPDFNQMTVPTHYIHHVVHVTHTHQYVLPTLPMSQMSTIHQATQVFHVDPVAIRSQPVLVTADDACAGCKSNAPTTTTMIPAGF